MANLYERVTEYPMVNESIKVASDAYSWVSGGERFQSLFHLSEQAANVLKSKAKALASTGAVSKIDDLACKHILDRMEAVFPSVKRPTEELFGPVADRALTAAESYLEYFMPDTKPTIDGSNPALSRYDRLMRLQTVLLQSEKVQASQTRLTDVYKKLQDNFTGLVSVASKEKRDAIIISIKNLMTEYQSSAAIAFPKFKDFVDGAVAQAQKFVTEVQNADNVSTFAVELLRTTMNGVHSTLVNLNERREAWMKGSASEGKPTSECVEMKDMKECD